MRSIAIGERRPASAPPPVRDPRRRALVQLALVVLAAAGSCWLTLYFWRTADFDVGEYADYARAFWLGRPPFAAFPLEYPPLALLPFSLALLTGPLPAPAAFALWMALLFLLGYLGCLRFAPRGAALRYAVYLLVAAQATLLARYDLVPALTALAALWAARRHRFTLAYILLAAGILIKLYPLVLLPCALIEHARVSGLFAHSRPNSRLWRRLASLRPPLLGGALCLGLVGAGLLTAWLRSSSGGLAFLAYATERPIQIESFPATLLWLGTFLGIPATHGYAFGADSYTGPLASGTIWALTIGLAAGCLLICWRQATGRLTIERASLLALCLLLLSSKVLSTQYLVWVLPLAAEVGGLEAVWLAIAVLTCLDYPMLYPFNQPGYTPAQVFIFMLIVAVRNVLLLAVALRLLIPLQPRLADMRASIYRMRAFPRPKRVYASNTSADHPAPTA